VAGETASLTNPALDRILDFAAESGLLVLIHSDIDMPFAKPDTEPVYLSQMKALLKRHPKTAIIWAHIGLGRVVHPTQTSASASATERSASALEIVEEMLKDPQLSHVCFDISWDEVAKYIVRTPQTVARVAELFNRYPERILFGTDNVAPASAEAYYGVYEMYAPLWKALTPEASAKIRKGNYERLFDEARRRVRAWESADVSKR
jgi:predicted TIM-barrel fold metal-dependent hydrolase